MFFRASHYLLGCILLMPALLFGMRWALMVDGFILMPRKPMILETPATLSEEHVIIFQARQEDNQDNNNSEHVPLLDDQKQFELGQLPEYSASRVPLLPAAYFKHFKSPNAPREVVVLYDERGNPLNSVEVTGILAKTFKTFLRQGLLKNPDIAISAQKRFEGCLISYTRLHDIVAIKRVNNKGKGWSRKKRELPYLNQQEIDRLAYEIDYVAYCSAYSDESQSAIKHLREQAKKK